LRRVVKKQLQSAIDQLAGDRPSDDSIHEARKSIKKVRAVLQVVGQDIGAGGRQLDRLRQAGQRLSPLRDADAVITSAQAICAHDRRALSARSCAALHVMLRREKVRRTALARRDHAAERAARALKRVQGSAKGWAWQRVRFADLAEEVQRSYKKARRGLRHARGDNDPDTFHTWRKRIKTLWYALRLLEQRMPRLRPLLSDLGRLETWLGDDHNLLVLRTQVMIARTPNEEQTPGARLSTLAERRQRELRQRALTLATPVFKSKPKAFAEHLRQMWHEQRDRMQRPQRRRTRALHEAPSRHRATRRAA
jgi:hypothetical protein